MHFLLNSKMHKKAEIISGKETKCLQEKSSVDITLCIVI